jgi:hypothetical protein
LPSRASSAIGAAGPMAKFVLTTLANVAEIELSFLKHHFEQRTHRAIQSALRRAEIFAG